jgi:hypothetical protein
LEKIGLPSKMCKSGLRRSFDGSERAFPTKPELSSDSDFFENAETLKGWKAERKVFIV